eukprot:COSAG02_NODE_36_length_48934_cov_144.851029_6_plen_104_part_00
MNPVNFKLMGSAGEPEPVQQFQLTHDISELWLCRLVISLPYSGVCALSSGCAAALVSIKRIKGWMLTNQDCCNFTVCSSRSRLNMLQMQMQMLVLRCYRHSTW